MIVIFGTTNKRKLNDLKNVKKMQNADIKVLSLDDVGWDRGEIEETGTSLEDNSLIKAKAIYEFCKERGLKYPIITDDAGLFCEALGGEPGMYTARYADDEIKENPDLPKYECVNKLLRNLSGKENRNAKYSCVVTCIFDDGTIVQTEAETCGIIAKEIVGKLEKPYLYSVFIPKGFDKAFSELTEIECLQTYRYKAMERAVNFIKNIYEVNEINKENNKL